MATFFKPITTSQIVFDTQIGEKCSNFMFFKTLFIVGTLFAVVSCLESLASFLGVFIFRLLYLATSEVSPGLSFVIGALLLIIPAVLVGYVNGNCY